MNTIIINNTNQVIDIIAIENLAKTIQFALTDEDGNAIDLSAETPYLYIKSDTDDENTEAVISKTGTISGAGNNVVNFSLTTADTAEDTGIYYWNAIIGDYEVSGEFYLIDIKISENIILCGGYYIYYIDHEDIFNIVNRDTMYLGKRLVGEGVPTSTDMYGLSEDEREFFNDYLEEISGDVYSKCLVYGNGIENGYFYNSQIIGDDNSQIKFIFSFNANWDSNTRIQLHKEFVRAMSKGIESMWYYQVGLDKQGAKEEGIYQNTLSKIKSKISARGTKPNLVYRSF